MDFHDTLRDFFEFLKEVQLLEKLLGRELAPAPKGEVSCHVNK